MDIGGIALGINEIALIYR